MKTVSTISRTRQCTFTRFDRAKAAIRSLVVSREGRNQQRDWLCEVFSRPHDAVIRVYDEAGNTIDTHEHAGDFKEW
jgi:hypothetical protein